MNDDKELYKWLVSMTSGKGIAKIENAPKDNGLLWTFGKRVGYLAEHGYGLVNFRLAFNSSWCQLIALILG